MGLWHRRQSREKKKAREKITKAFKSNSQMNIVCE
jgi:hypothetical protein